MATDPSLRALVRSLRADTTAGAAEVGRTAAEALAVGVGELEAGTVEELGRALLERTAPLLDAQPAMAPLHTLLCRVLLAIERAPSVEEARTLAARAARGFADGYEERADGVARRAADALSGADRVATISRSSTVVRALERWHASPDDHRGSRRAKRASVLCLESRPGREGQESARALARSGLEVEYAVDAAAYRLVPRCDALVLGADSVGDAGVANKIGSAAAAWAAATAAVPVLVLADTTKILPPGVAQRIDDDRPAAEVWDEPPDGVRAWNQYFEIVPMALVTLVISEDRGRAPDELARHRAGLALPSLLAGR